MDKFSQLRKILILMSVDIRKYPFQITHINHLARILFIFSYFL